MTQDEIIEMLRASCDKDKVDPEQNGFWVITTEELEDFAKLAAEAAAAKEREACAVIAETPISGEQDDITMEAKDRVAKTIRARGEA